MKESLTVLLIGVTVVFIGLLSLIGIIYLMSFIVRLARHEERAPRVKKNKVVLPEPQGFAPVPGTGPAYARLTGEKRRETVAVISAAIAESMGTDVSGIRIKSIRRVGGAAEAPMNADRRELVAVIAAAIAEELGTDVSGIRILSIKKAA